MISLTAFLVTIVFFRGLSLQLTYISRRGIVEFSIILILMLLINLIFVFLGWWLIAFLAYGVNLFSPRE